MTKHSNREEEKLNPVHALGGAVMGLFYLCMGFAGGACCGILIEMSTSRRSIGVHDAAAGLWIGGIIGALLTLWAILGGFDKNR